MASRNGSFGDSQSSARGEGGTPDLDRPMFAIPEQTGETIRMSGGRELPVTRLVHPTTGAPLPSNRGMWPKNVYENEEHQAAVEKAQSGVSLVGNPSDSSTNLSPMERMDKGLPSPRPIRSDSYIVKAAQAREVGASIDEKGNVLKSQDDLRREREYQRMVEKKPNMAREVEAMSAANRAAREYVATPDPNAVTAPNPSDPADILQRIGKRALVASPIRASKTERHIRTAGAEGQKTLVMPLVEPGKAYYNSDGQPTNPNTGIVLPLDKSHPDWEGLEGYVPRVSSGATYQKVGEGKPYAGIRFEPFARDPATGKPTLPHDEFNQDNTPIQLTDKQKAENDAARPHLPGALAEWAKKFTGQNTWSEKATEGPQVEQSVAAKIAANPKGHFVETTLKTHQAASAAATGLQLHLLNIMQNNPNLKDKYPDHYQHLQEQVGKLAGVIHGLDQVHRYTSAISQQKVMDDDGKVVSGQELGEVGRGKLVDHLETLNDIHRDLSRPEVVRYAGPVGTVSSQELANSLAIAKDSHKKNKFKKYGVSDDTVRALAPEPVIYHGVDITKIDLANPEHRAALKRVADDIDSGAITGLQPDIVKQVRSQARQLRMRKGQKGLEGADVNLTWQTGEGPLARTSTQIPRQTVGVNIASMGREGAGASGSGIGRAAEDVEIKAPETEETGAATRNMTEEERQSLAEQRTNESVDRAVTRATRRETGLDKSPEMVVKKGSKIKAPTQPANKRGTKATDTPPTDPGVEYEPLNAPSSLPVESTTSTRKTPAKKTVNNTAAISALNSARKNAGGKKPGGKKK